jgi:hypothetical protein
VQTILQQIQAAFARSGLTLDELRDRSGLKTERSNLGRKMAGKVGLRTSEAEALAAALSITIAVVPEAKRRRVS